MSNRLTSTKHISSLNLLRGVAALSVFCFHILGSISITWLKTIFSYGYLGLDLFFIISGFIIPYSMSQNNYSWATFPKFLLKRSIRIEIPYIASFLLIILMRIIHISVLNDWDYVHNWEQFWLHFIYLNQYFGYEPYNVVYWTLAIEFQFYIIIGLILPIIMYMRKIYSIIIMAVFCILIFHEDLPYNWFIFQYGFLFLTGVLIFLYTIKHIPLHWFLTWLVAVFGLMYFKNGVDVLLLAIFGTVAIMGIKREWKVSNFFGKISYSFYLVHVEAAGWFILFARASMPDSDQLQIVAGLFAFLFAVIFYYLFERPAFMLSKKVTYHKMPK